MCDYSLAHFPNRLAMEGETLMVHRFPSHSRGLTSVRPTWKEFFFPRSRPAVCVPPGAQLRLSDIPGHLQREWSVGPAEIATFVQQSADAYRYRDALRFANGREILLQRLPCGQRVDVLNLGGVEEQILWTNAEQKERAYKYGSD
jgi:hypothetical protein